MNANNGKSGTQGQGGLSWVTPGTVKNPSPAQQRLQAPQGGNSKPSTTPPMRNGGGFKLVGVFAVGAVVGLLLGWSMFSPKDMAPVAAETENEDESQATTSAASITTRPSIASSALPLRNEGTTAASAPAISTEGLPASDIIVTPGQEAGLSVTVSGMSVTTQTWVVVHENRNGAPGNILGAGLIFPGQAGGTIPLLRATVTGQTYFVGERQDNGDKVFSMQEDAPTSKFVQFVAE